MRTKGNDLVQGSPRKLLPDGEYPARLVGVERFTNSHQQTRLLLTYKIDSGQYADTPLMQSAQISTSPWGRLTTVLQDLLGRPPSDQELREGPALDQIGLLCMVKTGTDTNGSGVKYSAVRKAVRMPAALGEAHWGRAGRSLK